MLTAPGEKLGGQGFVAATVCACPRVFTPRLKQIEGGSALQSKPLHSLRLTL